MHFKTFMENLKEEKTIEVTMKSGHKFTAPIKMTHKDWHIVKHPTSGKQYRVDHKGNTLSEELDESHVEFRLDHRDKVKGDHKPTFKDHEATVSDTTDKATYVKVPAHKANSFKSAMKSKHGVTAELYEQTQNLTEGAYEKSEENKRSADAAKKQGDMFAHHLHMADHHDNLAQWHSEKGRHGEADRHAQKSEQHHEKAMSLKEETLEESMTDSWKKVQSMDKGSVTGSKDDAKKRLAYLNAVHDHHKKFGNDTKKVKGEIEALNRSRLAEGLGRGREDDEYHTPDPTTTTHKIGFHVSKDGAEKHHRTVTISNSSKSHEEAKATARAHLEKQGYKIHEAVEIEEAAAGHTMEAHGVKGMKNTPWRKSFKSHEHAYDWAEKNDAEIHGTRDLEQAKKGNLSPAMKEETQSQVHRVGVTVSDRNHPMVSRRKEKVQRFVNVTSNDKDKAITRAIKHLQSKGYTVHDHHYVGLKESVIDTQTRSDYKLDKAGRKSHKQIVFHDGTQNKELDDKLKREETEMQEEMTDAQKQERERLVKGMKKNIAGFKAKYGDQAKSVMYATATKNAMKEETEEQRKDREEQLKKFSGQVEGNTHCAEEVEVIDEKSEQARKNKTMKNMMDASRGARWKVQNKVSGDDVRDWDGKHKTAQAQNKAIGRALRNEDLDEAKEETPPFDGPYKKVKGDGNVKDKSGAIHTPMSRVRDLARQAMKKQMKEQFGLDLSDEQADSLVEAANVSEGLKGDQHKLDKNKNGKIDAHDFKLLRKEDAELTEAVESGNKGYGYHGQHPSETADKEYSKAHATVKKVAGAAGHLKDAKKPNVMVKHYLDSRHGRHLADVGTHDHEYIKKDFGKFKKNYNPAMHEAANFDQEGNLMAEKLKFSDFIEKMNEQLLEYESDDSGVYRHTKKATYGTSYQGDDDEDDKPKKAAAPAEKRGRGRPAGSTGASYKPRSAATAAAAKAKAAATKAANKNK